MPCVDHGLIADGFNIASLFELFTSSPKVPKCPTVPATFGGTCPNQAKTGCALTVNLGCHRSARSS